MKMRSLGNLAGGFASGYMAGDQMKRANEALALQKDRAGMEKQAFDSQTKFYDEMASLAKSYPNLVGTLTKAAPGGGVPANAGGVEAADQEARTTAPQPSTPGFGGMAEGTSPMVRQLMADAPATPLFTGRNPRRLPFSGY